MDGSCEKLRSVTENKRREEYPTNNTKEEMLT
jgi:hypothetical protein